MGRAVRRDSDVARAPQRLLACTVSLFRLICDRRIGGADDARLFDGLESYRVELDRKAAVLFAVEDGVDIVAWNRRGTRALAGGLPLPDLLDMRNALLEAVSAGYSGS
jgi:hypothetical protein